MSIGQKIGIGFLIAVLVVAAVRYFPVNTGQGAKEASEETQPELIMSTISIGTVGEDATKYIKRFQPTADYIAGKLSDEETNYTGKVIIAKTTEDMIELLKEQKIDLYLESPFTTALVAKESGAVPFLRRWKQEVPEYHTVFIVKEDSSINTLADFVGKTIAFEHLESTSGYLLPKAYLIKKGFDLSQSPDEDKITYVFTDEDTNTALWVIEGRTDIGAFSNVDFEETPENLRAQLKVIDRTFDVPRHMVSHRSELDPALVNRIKQILLDKDKDPEAAEILKNFKNTKKYDEIPDKEELFNTIDEMLTILG